MMDFELTDEQKAVQGMVRDFTAKEIIPNARKWDKEHRVDYKLTQKMGNLGILGICIPEKYGGAGMDYISTALACEELEYGETSFRVIMSVHLGLNSCGLLQWANEEQKQKYLVPQAQGKKLATFTLTEPNAGSDVQALETTATKEGDSYILNGTKLWISLATVADHFLVFGYTDKSKGSGGISAFIVESSWKGVSSSDIQDKL
ncbi:MAG: acyl-CoA dehydrogenase family protein, partial [Candidatus Heimdallarchaeota archaeon]